MKTRGSRRHLKQKACGEARLPALFTEAEEYLRRESQHLQGRPVRVQGREARVLIMQEGVGMQSIKTLVGVDVSAKTLAAKRRRRSEEKDVAREFCNDGAGHRELLKWMGKGARVCMEATGVYHLQLALMLVAAGVEV